MIITTVEISIELETKIRSQINRSKESMMHAETPPERALYAGWVKALEWVLITSSQREKV